MSRQEAETLVKDAMAALWEPRGEPALNHLRGARGLTDESIRLATLGFVGRLALPKADGGSWTVSGITVPWFESDKLTMCKIRRDAGKTPKYAQCFQDSPTMLAPRGLVHGRPLVITEGEFDAILLAQELMGLANVVSLGSASNAPSPEMMMRFKSMRPCFVAHDADDAGDQAAGKWPKHATRVRPPRESKDWCSAHQDGWPLRHWWEQWFTDEYAKQERASILEFDGGLTREEAERRAGLSESVQPGR